MRIGRVYGHKICVLYSSNKRIEIKNVLQDPRYWFLN